MVVGFIVQIAAGDRIADVCELARRASPELEPDLRESPALGADELARVLAHETADAAIDPFGRASVV
jgi:hypothetical protein